MNNGLEYNLDHCMASIHITFMFYISFSLVFNVVNYMAFRLGILRSDE